MRVMCIDDQWDGPGEDIVFGEVVTICNTTKYGDIEVYSFYEHVGTLYETKAFIPVSDIDETERIEEVLEQMFVKKEAV